MRMSIWGREGIGLADPIACGRRARGPARPETPLLDVLTRRVVDIGETFVVELELSSSPARSNEGLSCLTLMPGSLLPVD